jgi:hypothetical protein
MAEVRALTAVFNGPILVFDKDCQCTLPNVHVITHVGLIQQALGIVVQPDQLEALRKLLMEGYRPGRFQGPRNRAPPGTEEMAYADRFFEAMRMGQHIEPPGEGMFSMVMNNPMVIMTPTTMTILENDEEDTDFLRAQQESLQQSPPRRPRKLAATQESVLRASEPAKEGDAVCIACTLNRASILLIECNHQVMCDDCVRKMLSLPSADERRCPVCRADLHEICRPILSSK